MQLREKQKHMTECRSVMQIRWGVLVVASLLAMSAMACSDPCNEDSAGSIFNSLLCGNNGPTDDPTDDPTEGSGEAQPCPAGSQPGDACGDGLTCSAALICSCGNGERDGGEQCDGGDNCSSACEIICDTDADCGGVVDCYTDAVCNAETQRC